MNSLLTVDVWDTVSHERVGLGVLDELQSQSLLFTDRGTHSSVRLVRLESRVVVVAARSVSFLNAAATHSRKLPRSVGSAKSLLTVDTMSTRADMLPDVVLKAEING
jgi:hypothetical protein